MTYFADIVLPESIVQTVVGLLPFSITSPYQALLFAVMLQYVPFTFGIVYKSMVAMPDNVAPRKQNEMLKATHPTFGRIMAAEANFNEGFPYFATAVLAAVQAGVPHATLCLYATFWLLVRLAFAVIYVIQTNAFISMFRSLSFVASIATVG